MCLAMSADTILSRVEDVSAAGDLYQVLGAEPGQRDGEDANEKLRRFLVLTDCLGEARSCELKLISICKKCQQKSLKQL